MDVEETLTLAVQHYQAGRLTEAAALFVQVLKVHPKNVDAMHLLGLTMNRMGEAEQALELFDRAVDEDPEHAPALANRSMPLRTLGRLGEAEATLRAALRHRSHFPQARVMLAQVLLARGDGHGALRVAQHALEEAPDRRDVNEVLGLAMLQLGMASQALPYLGRAASTGSPGPILALADALMQADRAADAVTLLTRYPAKTRQVRLAVAEALIRAGSSQEAKPRLAALIDEGEPQARDLLARVLRDGGEIEQALDLLDGPDLTAEQLNTRAGLRGLVGDRDGQLADLRRAAVLNPDEGAVQHNLALALFQAGRADDALVAHRRALLDAPDDRARCIAAADSLARVQRFDGIEDVLRLVLAMPGVDHQLLENALRRVLQADPVVAASLADEVLHDGIAAALDRPLLHGLLRRTRVLGPSWERLLTRLRRAMMLDGLLDGHPELATSLAVQAWHTQYAWWADADELAAVDAMSLGDPEHWPRAAAYRPLPPRLPQPSSPGALPLWQLMVAQPKREGELADAMPVIGLTSDEISTAVRAQYEEHPYPRLVSVHKKPTLPLPLLLRQLLPWFDESPVYDEVLDVLIAGCGTGQQVLTAGCRYADARILAVDLSRASLGVAARLCEDWRLDYVELAQADILALGGLERRFQVIECGGVLHHMADPMAGWRVLVDLLAPGGIMKLGLYSEHARADVIAARELAARRGWQTTDEGLRQARLEIMALPPDHPAHAVVWSPDFPSLSGFRDLVMHACEHRFTLERLGAALDELGLELLGFQHPDPKIPLLYRAAWPDDPEQRDLERWAALELQHPAIFRGMLQFLCRRRA